MASVKGVGFVEYARQRALYSRFGPPKDAANVKLTKLETTGKIGYGALGAYFWLKNGFVAPPLFTPFTPVNPAVAAAPAKAASAAEIKAAQDNCAYAAAEVKEMNPGWFMRQKGLFLWASLVAGTAAAPLAIAAASAAGTLLLLAGVTPLVGAGLAVLTVSTVNFLRTLSLKQAQKKLFAISPYGAAQVIIQDGSQKLPCFKAFNYVVDEVLITYHLMGEISGKPEDAYSDPHLSSLEQGLDFAEKDLAKLRTLTEPLLFQDTHEAKPAGDRIRRLERVIIPGLEVKIIHRDLYAICNKAEDSYFIPALAPGAGLTKAEADLRKLQVLRKQLLARGKFNGTPEDNAVNTRTHALERVIIPRIKIREIVDQSEDVYAADPSSSENLKKADRDMTALEVLLNLLPDRTSDEARRAEERFAKLKDEIVPGIIQSMQQEAALLRAAALDPVYGEHTQILLRAYTGPDDNTTPPPLPDELIRTFDSGDEDAISRTLDAIFTNPDQIPDDRVPALMAKLDELTGQYMGNDALFEKIDEVRAAFEEPI